MMSCSPPARGLRVISNVAVGYNNIDAAAAKKRGVVVTNTPDVLTETTADFAWALLMAAARRTVEADAYARSGQWGAWKWDLLWGGDVHSKTLGVVGFGRIGRATRVDMDTLLRESDFISLHTLLTAEDRSRRLRGRAEGPSRPPAAPQRRPRAAHREGGAADAAGMASLAVRNCVAVLQGKPPLTPV